MICHITKYFPCRNSFFLFNKVSNISGNINIPCFLWSFGGLVETFNPCSSMYMWWCISNSWFTQQTLFKKKLAKHTNFYFDRSLYHVNDYLQSSFTSFKFKIVIFFFVHVYLFCWDILASLQDYLAMFKSNTRIDLTTSHLWCYCNTTNSNMLQCYWFNNSSLQENVEEAKQPSKLKLINEGEANNWNDI